LRPDSTLDRHLEILIAGAPFFVFGAITRNICQSERDSSYVRLEATFEKNLNKYNTLLRLHSPFMGQLKIKFGKYIQEKLH
jgi:hypothetical protein